MKPQPTTPESDWPFLIGIIALLALVVILALVMMSLIASGGLLSPAIPASAIPASVTPQTTLYPAIPFLTFLPPVKQTFAVAGEQTRQADMLTATLSFTPFTIVPPQYTYAPEPLVTGIFNNQTAPSPIKDFTIYNLWQNMVNGERVAVYAGFKQDHSGRILVSTVTADKSNRVYQTYDPPPGVGRLQVIAAEGDRLTLQDDQGNVLYFDVPTRQFVASLTGTVTSPTATQLPTWIPPTPAPPSTAVSTGYPSTSYP